MEYPFSFVAQGNIAELRAYLIKADIGIVDERGNSLLHHAIKYNQTEIFQYLIENSIDINIQNDDGETPLMQCVFYNRVGFLKELIRLNANHLLTNKSGETPFYKACFLGRGLIISLFIEKSLQTMDCKNNNDENIFFALLRAQNVTLFDYFAKEDKDFINSVNYFDETLLHVAVKLNSYDLVEYLLKNKAFVNAKNKAKETPLFYATKYGNSDIFGLLVQYGAIIELHNSYDETLLDVVDYQNFIEYINDKQNSVQYRNYIKDFPLHVAIIKEDVYLVEQLLINVYIDLEDSFGYKPLDLALQLKNKEIINLINEIKNKI